jgi:hypothetical protein
MYLSAKVRFKCKFGHLLFVRFLGAQSTKVHERSKKAYGNGIRHGLARLLDLIYVYDNVLQIRFPKSALLSPTTLADDSE